MSARPGSSKSQASDREIEAAAVQWIARRDAGLSAAEEAECRDWLAQGPRHRAAWERYGSAWAALDRPRLTGEPAVHVATLARRARGRRRRRLALAGGLAAMIACAFLFRPDRPAPSPQAPLAETAPAPRGQRLPDGSLVEFNADAEIAVDFSGATRAVRLVRGEAHFQVAHDPARPFVVSAGAVSVKAVGTAFAVRFDPQAVEVVVTEGRVTVDDTAGRPLAAAAEPIPAGNRVVVPVGPAPAPMSVTGLTDEQLGRRLAWRGTRLEFGGTPLSEAVARFNARNRTQVVIADPAVGALQVSGVFRADNLEGFVRLLEESFGVRAVATGADEIRLEARR